MHSRHLYFGKILADLASHSAHGYLTEAKDFGDGTGVYREEERPHHLMFSLTKLRFRFIYDTVTGQYMFYEMSGTRQTYPIVEGWDGLTIAQQTAFVGDLYGFLHQNGLLHCSLTEYLDELSIPPARVS